jgi:ubiquinol-cytochrome c reductase iron-sulfur subunit
MTFKVDPPKAPRAELLVAALLGGATVAALAFIAVLAVDRHDTQLLGLALGGAFALLAAAMIVAAKLVLPHEHALEERPELGGPRPDLAVPVTRRRLLAGAASAAATALLAALAVPVSALGPSAKDESPWRRGRRLVDEQGRRLTVDDVSVGSFVTAFPEGADPRALASPVVLVRDDPAKLDLPAGRQDWAPEGILAYSKICTHAGCAVALYRKPTYEPTSAPPCSRSSSSCSCSARRTGCSSPPACRTTRSSGSFASPRSSPRRSCTRSSGAARASCAIASPKRPPRRMRRGRVVAGHELGDRSPGRRSRGP